MFLGISLDFFLIPSHHSHQTGMLHQLHGRRAFDLTDIPYAYHPPSYFSIFNYLHKLVSTSPYKIHYLPNKSIPISFDKLLVKSEPTIPFMTTKFTLKKKGFNIKIGINLPSLLRLLQYHLPDVQSPTPLPKPHQEPVLPSHFAFQSQVPV